MPSPRFNDDPFGYSYDDIDHEALLEMGDSGYAVPFPAPGDDNLFDDQFVRRAREKTRQNSAIPVIITPQRQGIWTGNNQFGISQAFQPTTNNQQTILKLDTLDEPQVWSVMLNRSQGRSGSTFTVVAKIQPGAGGFVDEFEVDWNNGVTFNTVMNALNIIALYTDQNGSAPPNLQLSAIIGKRNISGNKPTRTFNIALDSVGNPGAIAFIDYPKYAKSFEIVPGNTHYADAFTANLTFGMLDGLGSGTTRCTVDGSQIGPIYHNDVPLPGGTQTLVVTNAGANAFNLSVIFKLSL